MKGCHEHGRGHCPHCCPHYCPHYCPGARLAQMEISAVLSVPAHEVESIEPAGYAAWSIGHFVSGAKHLPVRCQLA